MKFIPYKSDYAEKVVKLWRMSKREALGEYTEPHDFNGFLTFLKDELEKSHTMHLVINEEDQVIGFLAFKKGELDQLYVDSKFHGKGIGTRLLNIAKTASPKGLKLYTFQCNKKAQKFYENHGFKIVKYGNENEENLPDILYSWDG